MEERAIGVPKWCNFARLRASLHFIPRAARSTRPVQIEPREV